MAQRGAASRGHGAVPDAVRAQVLALLLCGQSVESAAETHELASSTVRKWLEAGTEFRLEYETALAAMKAHNLDALIGAQRVAIDTLARAARDGDVGAAATLLRATTSAKIEHAGHDGGAVKVEATVVRFPVNPLGDKP